MGSSAVATTTGALAPGNVPAEQVLPVLRVELEARRAQSLTALERARELARLKVEWEREVRAALGEEKHRAWRAFVAERRELLQRERARLATVTHEALLRIAEDNRREAARMAHSLGLEQKTIRTLNRTSVDRFAAAVRVPELSSRAELSTVGPSEVGAKPYNAIPSTVMVAPYAGANATLSEEWLRGFYNAPFVPDTWVDRLSGMVGNINAIADDDASDYDVGLRSYDVCVWCWYQMPASGLLEVFVEGQLGGCHLYALLEDEWGWSDAYVHQRCRLLLQAYGSETLSSVLYAPVASIDRSGTDTGAVVTLQPGSTRWGHFFTDVAFRKGDWVLLRAGIQTHHDCFANDVRVRSSMWCRAVIKSIWLAPA